MTGAADMLRAWIRGEVDDNGNPTEEDSPVAERKSDPAQGKNPRPSGYNNQLNGDELLGHIARGLGGTNVRINNVEY